jgi:hypothetical protein
VPFFMALECEALIRGMLCKSMTRRLSAAKIKEHEWLEFETYSKPKGPEYTPPARNRPRPRHMFASTSSSSIRPPSLDGDDSLVDGHTTPPTTRRNLGMVLTVWSENVCARGCYRIPCLLLYRRFEASVRNVIPLHLPLWRPSAVASLLVPLLSSTPSSPLPTTC